MDGISRDAAKSRDGQRISPAGGAVAVEAKSATPTDGAPAAAAAATVATARVDAASEPASQRSSPMGEAALWEKQPSGRSSPTASKAALRSAKQPKGGEAAPREADGEKKKVPRSRGKSIVFEGLGRVGKTTQAKFLADDINALRPE